MQQAQSFQRQRKALNEAIMDVARACYGENSLHAMQCSSQVLTVLIPFAVLSSVGILTCHHPTKGLAHVGRLKSRHQTGRCLLGLRTRSSGCGAGGGFVSPANCRTDSGSEPTAMSTTSANACPDTPKQLPQASQNDIASSIATAQATERCCVVPTRRLQQSEASPSTAAGRCTRSASALITTNWSWSMRRRIRSVCLSLPRL